MSVLTFSGAVGARQARADRERTQREWNREIRQKTRAKIRDLRDQIKALRRSKPERMRRVRELCREARIAHREHARAERERLRLERLALRERLRLEREELPRACAARKARAREALDQEIEGKRRELAETLDQARDARKYGAATGARDTRNAAERRAEDEDEVRGNIPPELVPVWEKVRGKIKRGSRSSLTEAFLEWTHNNSAAVSEILYSDEIEHLRAIERDEAALSREWKRVQRTGARPSARLLEALEAAGVAVEPAPVAPTRRRKAPVSDDWGGL